MLAPKVNFYQNTFSQILKYFDRRNGPTTGMLVYYVIKRNDGYRITEAHKLCF